MREPSSTILARWRTARRAVLGSLVLAGTVASSAALVRQATAVRCDGHVIGHSYTYGGVGILLVPDGDDVVIRDVFPGTPAMGKLPVGARLVSVDGQVPSTPDGWAPAIRGAPGTRVELQLAYPCGGESTVVLERDVIRMHGRGRGF